MSGLPLAYLLSIVLGSLVALAFGAGFIKLCINKRRLKINQKKADEEAAAKATDREKLVGRRKLGEGDLFGVRAIEHGYFGGVAQSRPSSPASSYKLATDAKLVDWGSINKLRSDSSSITSSNVDDSGEKNTSTTSLGGASTIRKPSPLRLQPSDAEMNGSHNMSSVGGMGGNFLPPLPSPRSIRSPSPLFNEEKISNWVSPLDVHFSRPSTPARPASFLPKLNLPLEFGQSELMGPMPDFNKTKEADSIVTTEITTPVQTVRSGPVKTPKEIYAEFAQQGFAKSPTLSTFPTQDTLGTSPTFSTFSKEETKAKSPTFSVFPQQANPPPTQPAPPRPNRLSMNSMLETEDTARRPHDDFSSTFQLPSVPLDDLAPRIPAINPDRFPTDLKVWTPTSPIRDSILNKNRQPQSAGARLSQQWNLPSPTLPDFDLDTEWQPPSNAVIRASIVSKQRVSIIRGANTQSQDLDINFAKQSRAHSMAASSMYSTRTSILEPGNRVSRHVRTRSQSSEVRPSIRDRSNSFQRRITSRSLSRSRDSLRESRKTSSDSFKSADSHRRSRDRDQLHFDPSSHRRNRCGSIQGRSVDFDQPRESPFSNSNQTSNHSATSSLSSSVSSGSLSRFEITSPEKYSSNNPYQQQYSANSSVALQHPPQAAFQFPQDPERLSITPQMIHGRTNSEVSQNSIGEFYDSYYRQSTMGADGRISQMPNAIPMGPGPRTSVQDRAQLFEDRARGRAGSAPRRPAPLKIGGTFNGGNGGGYGGFTPIVEVASPMPSPMVGEGGERGRGRERFPQMI